MCLWVRSPQLEEPDSTSCQSSVTLTASPSTGSVLSSTSVSAGRSVARLARSTRGEARLALRRSSWPTGRRAAPLPVGRPSRQPQSRPASIRQSPCSNLTRAGGSPGPNCAKNCVVTHRRWPAQSTQKTSDSGADRRPPTPLVAFPKQVRYRTAPRPVSAYLTTSCRTHVIRVPLKTVSRTGRPSVLREATPSPLARRSRMLSSEAGPLVRQ
jgi:hypothetical protein